MDVDVYFCRWDDDLWMVLSSVGSLPIESNFSSPVTVVDSVRDGLDMLRGKHMVNMVGICSPQQIGISE